MVKKKVHLVTEGGYSGSAAASQTLHYYYNSKQSYDCFSVNVGQPRQQV